MRALSLIAGAFTGPGVTPAIVLFALGGAMVASNGAGRWDPPLPMAYRVGGSLVVFAFVVFLVGRAFA